MSTWSQYFVSQSREEKVRAVAYVCGTEPILIQWVVDHITRILGVSPWNFSMLVAGQDSDREIWAEIDRHPIDRSSRLVIVRNFEALKDKTRIIDWVAAHASNPRTFLVLVENTPRVPMVQPTTRGGTPTQEPYVAALARRGHVVECRPFTQATTRHAVSWVRSLVYMQENVASHLLNRANGDLRLVRDTCLKLAVLEDAPGITSIDTLLSRRPRIEFREALLQRRKQDALFALTRMPSEDYSRVLGQLDSDLEITGLVYDLTNQHARPSDIIKAAGKLAFLVPRVRPYAKHYPPKRRDEIRRLLATADEAIKGGERVGVMEGLVSLW